MITVFYFKSQLPFFSVPELALGAVSLLGKYFQAFLIKKLYIITLDKINLW